MSSPQALLLSGQVREVLAGQDLERLAEMAATGFRCVSCGRRGVPADGPASVVIVVRPQRGSAARAAVVGLAHARCSPPRVIEENNVLEVPANARMAATAVLLPSPGGPRPLLVTELSAAPVEVTGPGERHDLAAGALLGLGLRLLASPWDPAPPARGWSVRLSRRSAVVTCPVGRYYEGGLDQPPQWRQAAERLGSVELLAGTAGVGAAVPGLPGPGIAALEQPPVPAAWSARPFPW